MAELTFEYGENKTLFQSDYHNVFSFIKSTKCYRYGQ